MRLFTSIGCSSTSKPATVAVPSEGGRKHVRMRIVVVLPAPFGPRKPTICPFGTSNEIPSTATVRAYRFERSLTVIINYARSNYIDCERAGRHSRRLVTTLNDKRRLGNKSIRTYPPDVRPLFHNLSI